MSGFKPLEDKAELGKLLQQLLAEAEADVAQADQRDAATQAGEQAGANAQQFQKSVLGEKAAAAPVQGQATDKASLWNLRFKK